MVIFVDERFDGVAIVIGDDRQGTQGFGLEPIHRAFSRLAMQSLIGGLGEPLPCLAVDVMQVREIPQRPEGLACIPDSALDLSFLPAGRGVAGFGTKAMLSDESQESRQKADQAAIMFGDRGRQVVIGDFSGDAAHRQEGVHVTTGEGQDIASADHQGGDLLSLSTAERSWLAVYTGVEAAVTVIDSVVVPISSRRVPTESRSEALSTNPSLRNFLKPCTSAITEKRPG